jgi:ubiquinone/menaquinone biosynthesis C-methylase UbiE
MRFENKSFEELGIDEDSVDAVVLADVIEHLDHPETILREARRILKPGGSLIMTTPIKKPRGSWDALHVREYTESSIRSLLRDFFPRTRVDRFMPLVLFRTYQRFRFARYAFNSLKLLKMNPFAISIPGMRHVMLRSVSEK